MNTNIDFIEKQVTATMQIEGLKPSKIGKSITKKYLTGELNSKEAIEQIKNYHLEGGINNGQS